MIFIIITLQQLHILQIKSLDMSFIELDNGVDDVILSTFLNKVEKLNISRCQLNSEAIKTICDAISQNTSQVKVYNTLGTMLKQLNQT